MKDNVRLNASIRATLKKAVLRHKFQKEGDELFEERRRIALCVYNYKFTEVVQKQMNELPEGWLQECDSINFSAGGQSYCYRFDGKVWWNKIEHSIAYSCINHDFSECKKSRCMPHRSELPRVKLPELVMAVQ